MVVEKSRHFLFVFLVPFLFFVSQEIEVVSRSVERIADFLRAVVLGRERLAQQQEQQEQEKDEQVKSTGRSQTLVDRYDQTVDTAAVVESTENSSRSRVSAAADGGSTELLENGVDVAEAVAARSDHHGVSGNLREEVQAVAEDIVATPGKVEPVAPVRAPDDDDDDDDALDGAFLREGEGGMPEVSATVESVIGEAVLGGDGGEASEVSSADPVADTVPW